MTNWDWWVCERNLEEIRMEMKMGRQLVRWVKGHIPGGLNRSVQQKILPILPNMPHSGCAWHVPPTATHRWPCWEGTFTVEITVWGGREGREGRRGFIRFTTVIAGSLVKFILFLFNFMSLLLTRWQALNAVTFNLQEGFYIGIKASGWRCTVSVNAFGPQHVQ